MFSFRNRNSGQVVTVQGDPSHLSGLARWERIAVGPSAPTADTEVTAVAEVAAITGTPAPGDTATRDEWVAHAKAHGKTDAQIKGKRTETIQSWFATQ